MAELRQGSQKEHELVRRLLKERRTKTRFPCHLQAICRPGSGRTGLSWSAAVRDISPKGVRLVLPRHFSPGTVLTLNLHHDQGPVIRTEQVRVVFVRQDASGWVHGCQFFERLSEGAVEELGK